MGPERPGVALCAENHTWPARLAQRLGKSLRGGRLVDAVEPGLAPPVCPTCRRPWWRWRPE